MNTEQNAATSSSKGSLISAFAINGPVAAMPAVTSVRNWTDSRLLMPQHSGGRQAFETGRRRDSTSWEILGDDIGIVILERGFDSRNE